MQHFFGLGSGAMKLKYHVGLRGVQLTTDSDVGNACDQRMRQLGKDTKIPAGTLGEQLIDGEEAGVDEARWMRSVPAPILGELEGG